MTVRIAHASKDERNKYKNGKAGDQTHVEVYIRTWYSKPWQYVIRFKDASIREKVAKAMEMACKNELIGYDQNQRNSLLSKARMVGYDPSKVTSACETDCSALVSLACIYAGIPEASLVVSGNSATTTTLRSRLIKTGKVEVFSSSKYTRSDNYLLRGDILLKEGSHVVVALDNGNKAVATSPATPTTSTTYTQTQFIKDVQSCTGSKVDGKAGDETLGNTVTLSTSVNKNHPIVTPIERYLKVLGYYTGTIEADIGKPPCFGSGLKTAVMNYQERNGCTSDGVITAKQKTWKKLLGML